ncbi:hypothetical protein AWB78_07786 [Caballeronia calidae]|uniref:Uncharacterized protein n=1 Tax=Caballeronia calidae TaxID=1777139 RepID=A0A158EJ56_9BURK|nr:hypothetical protein [Caballeronia calidae]SAL05937.1 hypothetical protein AWB78_07786 [Caballeronia calidae]
MQSKIEGLDSLTRQLEEASRAFKSLGGELEQVNLERGNQQSVQAAIEQVEAIIDQKAAPYWGNELVESMVQQLKKRYREEIIRRGRA